MKTAHLCSAIDIRLDWEVYNIDKDDEQLIDLIIDIGVPHLKIVQGKEMVPARMTSDLPLITVDVRQHIGRLENVPFSIKQSQQVRSHIIILHIGLHM